MSSHTIKQVELTTAYRRSGDYAKPSLGSRLCNCIANIICLAPLVVGGYFLWEYFGRPSAQEIWDQIRQVDVSDFNDVLQNLTDIDWDAGFNEDPYVGDNSTKLWKGTNGYGLTLTLQNALNDTWQDEFYAAVEDWQEAEALELTTTRVDVDNKCSFVDGVMKVCNGNFGATGWLGINEVQMEFMSNDDPGYIVSSVAKMNEYYLNKADYAKRRYTMCHEIGHGFGLSHTDENMYNQDMGNCLDYTNTPENNMYPGDINFERLADMYLYAYADDDDDDDGNDDQQQQDEDGQQQQDADDNLQDDDVVADENDDGNGERRFLRREIRRRYIWA